MRPIVAALAAAAIAAASLTSAVGAESAPMSFVKSLPTVSQVGSTVPGNGDVNPYGVAVVPVSMGSLVKNDILVSNFNNKANLQGTGTTIVELSPSGHLKVFATIMADDVRACRGGIGLTTALVALRNGWVVVGSLPTSDGMSATARAGCLIFLNSSGKVVTTIHGGLINGPWDMTAMDNSAGMALFVSNVLNGTVAAGGKTVHRGTVVRIDLSTSSSGMPMVTSERVIGWGFAEKTDPAALVIGPTGLALSDDGTLYVADTLGSRIAAIPNAANTMTASHRGRTVSTSSVLNQPLGLALAPNDDILAVNAGDGNIVEISPSGHLVTSKTIDSAGGGSLFGLAVKPGGSGIYFVEDDTNMLALLH
jgi:hypothetical protein